MKLPPPEVIFLSCSRRRSCLVAGAGDLGGGAVGFGEDHVAVLVAHAVDRARRKTPLAMAWARLMVFHASTGAAPNSDFSLGAHRSRWG